MEIQPDFRDLLALFNAHSVEYMIVGGYALAFHGAPRYTGDIDLFVRPNAANARQILTALDEFGRAEFISNKRSTGRKKDLADLEALGEE